METEPLSFFSAETLSSLLGEIYNAAITGKWDDVLDNVMQITQSNKAFFFFQKLDLPKPLLLEFRTNFEYSQEVFQDYQQRTLEDPLYQTMVQMPEGDCANLTDHVKIEHFSQTAFYQEIYVPLKVKYSIASVVARDAEYESAFAINRGEGDPGYDERVLGFMRLITPHVVRAIHIYKELTLYKHYASISKSVLDQSDKAIIVCDQNGRIISTNAFADEYLIPGQPIYIERKQLCLAEPVNQQRLHSYIAQCSRLYYNEIGAQQTILLEANNHLHALITVSPLKQGNHINDFYVLCALVTVKFQQAMNWPLVVNEMKLTSRELSLLKAIYAKRKLNELADTWGISYNTLRTHLQNIFKKFQVNSQTELMVKLSLFKA